MSNTEKFLTALIKGEDVSNFKCRSRIEQYLKKCCMKETCEDMTPQSRVEYLLGELSKVVCEGGGSSGGEIAKIVSPESLQGTTIPVGTSFTVPIPPTSELEMMTVLTQGEGLYCNPHLTIDEVIALLERVSAFNSSDTLYVPLYYSFLGAGLILVIERSNVGFTVTLSFMGEETVFIKNSQFTYAYNEMVIGTFQYSGLLTNFVRYLIFENIPITEPLTIVSEAGENVGVYNDLVGAYNDLLKDWISYMPFTTKIVELSGEYDGNKINVTDNGVIDIEEMIGEKKIPLKVNVNVPTPEGYIKPEGNIEITENGTHDVSQYESAIVNVASSGEGSSLKKLLDFTKSTYYLFSENKSEDVSGVIKYDDTSNVEKMDYMFYKCSNLVSAPLLNTGNVSSMNFVFDSCSKLTEIPQFDTSNVTQLQGTFQNCYALQTIPLLNTNKVTNMYKLFSGCSNLVTVPQLDTSKVTDMRFMFSGCNNLVTLPQMNTDNVTTLYRTFQNCYKLEKIDITSVDKLSSTDQMAANCYSLKKIIIRSMTKIPSLNTSAFTNCYHLTGTVDSTYNPNGAKDCYIYVPDIMVDSLKAATNWSTYADQIKPLSELVED